MWYLADKLRWGDGKKAHRQPVQAIVLRCKGKGKGKRNTDGGGWQLMTGGAGGVIKFWSAPKDGDPLYDSAAAACSPLFMVELEARVPGQPAPGIKALDTLAKGKGELLVGTDKCDLWRLKLNDDGAASGEKLERLKPGTGGGKGYRLTQMVKGHRKDVEGLDCHPTYEGVFATCSESERIFLWDARAHLQLSEGMLKTGGTGRVSDRAPHTRSPTAHPTPPSTGAGRGRAGDRGGAQDRRRRRRRGGGQPGVAREGRRDRVARRGDRGAPP